MRIYSRTEYCNVPHSSSDVLYGTKIGEEMESHAVATDTKESGLSLQAFDFYDESGAGRIQTAFDFSGFRSVTVTPGFTIALLGMVHRSDSSLQRGIEAGCDSDTLDRLGSEPCRESIPNHCETKVDLPPVVMTSAE